MIALGLLVTVSVLPALLNAALPETTAGPVGLARPSAAKHEATSAHNSFTRGTPRNDETIRFPLQVTAALTQFLYLNLAHAKQARHRSDCQSYKGRAITQTLQ